MEKKGAAAGARDVNLLVWVFFSYSGCNLGGKLGEGYTGLLCNLFATSRESISISK